MAVTLTGSNGLFTRLGKLLQLVVRVEAHQTNGTTGLAAEIEDVQDVYSNADMYMIRALVGVNQSRDDAALPFQIAAAQRLYSAVSEAVANTIIEMVNDDTPLRNRSLTPALLELIEQMESSSDSIDGNSTGASHAANANNTGDGNVARFTVQPGTLSSLQHVRAETIVAKCIQDAQAGVLAAGSERFELYGEEAVTDPADPSWPGGSGINGIVIQVTDPAIDGTQRPAPGRQMLVNGAFESFTTANTPDNWEIITGAAGTDIEEEGTVVFRGDKALQFNGDGTILVKIRQQLNSSGGSPAVLKPLTVYIMSWQYRIVASTTAGVMRYSIQDSGGTILNSTNAQLAFAHNTPTDDTWTWSSTAFTTGESVPSTVYAVLEMTTALSNSHSVYFDQLLLTEAPQYGGLHGLQTVILPGATDWVVDDRIDYTMSNDDASDFARLLDKMLNMRSQSRQVAGRSIPLQLPFNGAGSETIADSLIA